MVSSQVIEFLRFRTYDFLSYLFGYLSHSYGFEMMSWWIIEFLSCHICEFLSCVSGEMLKFWVGELLSLGVGEFLNNCFYYRIHKACDCTLWVFLCILQGFLLNAGVESFFFQYHVRTGCLHHLWVNTVFSLNA